MNTRVKHTAGTVCGRFLVALALAALPMVAACGSNPPQAGQTVEVHLTENAIEMPSNVAAGKTTFKVVNTGTAVHGFSIEGPSGETAVPSVEPGKTASVQMTLDPGTYRVLSPVDANKGGMVLALNVTQG